jgi:hypothetical protein
MYDFITKQQQAEAKYQEIAKNVTDLMGDDYFKPIEKALLTSPQVCIVVMLHGYH